MALFAVLKTNHERVAGVEYNEPPGNFPGGALRSTPATQNASNLVLGIVSVAHTMDRFDDRW